MRDFRGGTKPFQGNESDIPLALFLRKVGNKIGFNKTWRNTVDGDLPARHFLGQRTGERHLASFRRGVIGLPGKPEFSYGRGDEDDSAIALAHEAQHRLFADIESPRQIGVDHPLPVGFFHQPHYRIIADAGTVDHDLEGTVLFLHKAEKIFHLVVLSDIKFLQVQAVGAVGVGVAKRIGGLIVGLVGCNDLSYGLQEGFRNGAANSPRSPNHNGGLT